MLLGSIRCFIHLDYIGPEQAVIKAEGRRALFKRRSNTECYGEAHRRGISDQFRAVGVTKPSLLHNQAGNYMACNGFLIENKGVLCGVQRITRFLENTYTLYERERRTEAHLFSIEYVFPKSCNYVTQ